MIPDHEITALIALIERLEGTPKMTPIERFYKERARKFRKVIGTDTLTATMEKTKAKAPRYQREKNHPVYGDTHFSLIVHVTQLSKQMDDWFAWAHLVPPQSAERIKANLKRAKLAELNSRFCAAYDKHLGDYWVPSAPRSQSGDSMFDILQDRVPKLQMTLKSFEDEGFGQYKYEFEFCCRECGGYMMRTQDDDASDDGPFSCVACGIVFGSLADVKALGQYIGSEQLRRLGLSTSAPLPKKSGLWAKWFGWG